MAARITPATALGTVRQLGADLARWTQEAGNLSAAPQLVRQLDDLQATVAAPRLLIEVWDSHTADSATTATWLLGVAPGPLLPLADGSRGVDGVVAGRPIRLVFATADRPATAQAGQVVPPLLIWMKELDAQPPPGLDDRPLVIVVTTSGERLADQPAIARGEPDGALTRFMAMPAMTSAVDLLQAEAAARALDALAGVAGLAMQQEGRAIRARRALLQQRAGAGPRPAASLTDMIAAQRSRLQRSFSDFSRGIDDRFAATLSAPAAPFWRALDEHLSGISELDREPRVKSLVTRLPTHAEEAWLDMVRQALVSHCLADLAALRDMLRAAGREIEEAVAEAGGPPLVVQFQHLTDDRVLRLVDQQLVPQRRYQGEIPRPGFFEYLMAARRYQMVVFMFLSAFGLSFLRTYREFMIPAAIGLLSLGMLQVAHSVKRERIESVAKELDKVREQLRNETRRMIADVQRAWPGLVSQHLSDQLPLALGNAEASVRDFFARVTNDAAEERQRLQRQLQSFEVAERKLTAPMKGRETVSQAIAHVRGELRQLIAAAVRGLAS